MAYSNHLMGYLGSDSPVTVNQSSTPVTDMTAHIDGGHIMTGTNATAPVVPTANLHLASGIVIGSIVLLWAVGALVLTDSK